MNLNMTRMRIAVFTALLLGTTVFACAQQPEEPKPPKQEDARPHGDEDKRPERQEIPKTQKEQREQKDQRPAREEKGQPMQEGHARPAGKSAHIPDAKFKASFGREHHFAVRHVITTTNVVAGQTNFVYGGYTFVILDPWPAAWLFTDDCYVDYVDGDYFLFDVMHPGIRIALFVEE